MTRGFPECDIIYVPVRVEKTYDNFPVIGGERLA
jgi:hypothetical protein